jgi:hypothetical protein
MEVHHIKAHADGGQDVFENAIPLCFDCHAIVRQYDPKHPKGIRFTENELIQHRDNWYAKIKGLENEKTKEEKIEPARICHEKNYQDIMLYKAENGKAIISLISGACAYSYDEESENIEETNLIGEFIQNIKEILDYQEIIEEPIDRLNVAFDLTEKIKKLDEAGFWVFIGKENRILKGGIGKPEDFPVLLLRIVRKTSNEILKIRLDKEGGCDNNITNGVKGK